MNQALDVGRPEIDRLREGVPFLWPNPSLQHAERALAGLGLQRKDLLNAEARWQRFAPTLAELFAELADSGGVIESPLRAAPKLQALLRRRYGAPLRGRLLLKEDHALPVAGSVKARGGIYAVLCHVERLALQAGLLRPGDAYQRLLSPEAREHVASYGLAVASTGNLGLSVGIMGAAFGLRVTVHMSTEAKAWKKDRLRQRGVRVVEHAADYTAACAIARQEAADDARTHFIDDENSVDLFLGYSVAALRLREQLCALDIAVDGQHPLFVYLPCGVGGAPGGITFGLKHVLGDHVHCFFAEPTQAPSMLLGLLTGRHEAISVYDIGLSGVTAADGLAVPRPSRLVGPMIKGLVSGCYTVSDAQLYRFLADLRDTEEIEVEPSAAAGVAGPVHLEASRAGRRYLSDKGMRDSILDGATHVIWTTGGSLVPRAEYEEWYARGRRSEQGPVVAADDRATGV